MLRPLLHASVCALLITPAVDGLRLGAKEGETIRRTISLTIDRELDSATQLMNGEDRSGAGGERSQSSTNSLEIVVLDEIQGADDGMPTKILRSYETIEAEVSQDSTFGERSNSSQFDMVSEVEGEQVLFTYEDEEWSSSIPEGSTIDEAYLEGLTASMDLALLLPDDEVAEGDEWEAPIDLMEALTRPGGELGLHSEEEDDYEIDEVQPETERDGTITVTHGGTSEDDENLIVLEIRFETTSTTDLTEAMRAQFESMGDSGQGMVPSVNSARRSTEAEGTGEALWNSRAGRLESFNFEIEINEVMEQDLVITTPTGDDIQIESTQESSGTAVGSINQESVEE